jgi:predicted permease
MRHDVAHGVRLLRRSPVFTLTASLSLAIGIGANTAIFTVANALLFRPPAGIADPSALVVIGTARGDGGVNPLNHELYRDIAQRVTSLTGVYAEEMFPHVMGMTRSGSAVAEPVLGRYVTTNFFSTLGATMSRGRAFADADEASAVLDYDYWTRRLDGDASIVGQLVRVNGRSVTIVGVAAPEFSGTGVQKCDLWLAMGSRDASTRTIMAGGRLRPGTSFRTAAAELGTVGQNIDRDRGTSRDQARALSAIPFSRAGGNRNVVRGFAGALMVLASLVLAVACANVAGIMLTRLTTRAREIVLRAALGAGRSRLVRQLFTETIVLFLFSGLLAIALSRPFLQLAMLMLPPLPMSLVVPLTLDWRVVLFALCLSVFAAVAFGVVPAFRGSKPEAGSSLKHGVRSSSGRSHVRGAFVAGQIACSVLLVVLAGLFVRILRDAGASEPGFDSRGVNIATVDASLIGHEGRDAMWQTMIERVRQTPAVETASLARVPPGGFEGIGLGDVAPGDQPQDALSPGWNIVGAGYFKTLRIPIVAGRDFGPEDTAGTPPVVVVSEAVARRFWRGQSAIGKRLDLKVFNAQAPRAGPGISTVIGVVGDIKSTSLIDGVAAPYVYLPLAQSEALVGSNMSAQMSIVVRRRSEPSPAPAIASIVQDADERLVLARMESLTDAIALGLTPQRVLAIISGVMGFVTLLLASMGIYGITAYSVALRRREFAIRLALGIPRARVIQMVLKQSTSLVVVGLAIGLALAIGAGHVLSAVLGVPALHVSALAGTVALFLAIAMAASVVPAGQAVREGWRRALQED